MAFIGVIFSLAVAGIIGVTLLFFLIKGIIKLAKNVSNI